MTEISNDIFFKNFISAKQNASSATIKNYNKTLTKFCKATNATLEEIITKCKNQQDKIIEKTTYAGKDEDGNTIVEKTISKFNVNSIESYIKLYFDTYINYCKSNGNKNTTINYELIMLKSFFNYYDIETPSIEKLEDDSNDWYLLSKEDFKYVMSESTLMHQTLISLLKATGIRLSDALSLTWGDIMKFTNEYHDCVTLEEFAEKAPQNMIGMMEFYPQKTKRHNILCITGIDPETCNLLLQLLNRLLKESIPLINKKYPEKNAKITKDSPVFGSKRYYFQKAVTQKPVTTMFSKKNKALREHHIAMINERVSKGELSEEDKEEEIKKIPKFHAHACRKFFETMISRNCSNLRICALLEGHTPPMATDSHYIKIDVCMVKEAYMAAIPDLSLENTETKVYTSDVRREMESKLTELENKNKLLESENENLKEQHIQTNDRLDNLERLILGDVSDKKLSEIHKSL